MDRLSRACVRIIDRYQASDASHVLDGGCRFEPSCCTYMREAFTTRSFPVAWLLSAWRVVRCNPLSRPHSADPLVRARRLRARPNTARTAFAAMCLAGLVTLLVGGAAGAQSLNGPCNGSQINGRDPRTMTKDHPLLVGKGQNVTVNGVLQGATEDTKSVTNIQVDLISGVWSATEVREGEGPTWGGTVNVDTYLTKGKGLYRVHGTATATGGISCSGDGYIKLDGAGVIAAIGAGVGGVGLVGSILAPGISRTGLSPSDFPAVPAGRMDVTMGELGDQLDRDIKRPIPGLDAPELVEPVRAPIGGCCLVTMLAIPLVMVGMAGDGAPGATDPVGTPPSGTVLSRRRVWKRGHAVWGFLSGLLLGLGGTVFLQQQAVWVLDIWTAIVLPLALALLVAIRAWIGRPYAIVRRAP